MARHFMAFLGTGAPDKGYTEVAYRFDDGGEITNKFVQLSLIDKYCSDYAGDDKRCAAQIYYNVITNASQST
jgi:hypothetical protein